MKKIEETVAESERLNLQLAQILENEGIKNFRITALGNSISSGYSGGRTIKPLLVRNEGLGKTMELYGITPEVYSFARAQNNNDERIFSWILNNIKLSEIYAMNRHDYGTSASSMREYPYKEVYEMFTRYPNPNPGLKDVILDTMNNLANIVVYNGCTGSFLDIWTRGGDITKGFTYGFNRDITSIEATLKLIQESNRYQGTNTQVYLCGVPDIFRLKITNLIPNRELKQVANRYANVVYVDTVPGKGVYKTIPTDSSSAKTFLDVHYDELEYLELNNNIIDAIIKNYRPTEALINMDRKLLKKSSDIELNYPSFKDSSVLIDIELDNLLNEAYETIGNNPEETIRFSKKAKKYLTERAPYDYFYIGKVNIKKKL